MSIYTVTHVIQNYGSILQAYALQHKLKELGADTGIITLDQEKVQQNRSGGKKAARFFKAVYLKLRPEENYSPFRKVKLYLERKKYAVKNSRIRKFMQEKLTVKAFTSLREASATLKDGDILLAGSDQIWSLVKGDIRPLFRLEWPGLPDGVRKCSYAASLGTAELTDEQKEYYRGFLSSFETVSLREQQAANLLRPLLDNPVRCDLDPTLLYDGEFWEQITAERIIKEPYIFVYMLRPDRSVIEMACKAAAAMNCQVVYTGLMADRFPHVRTVYDAGIEEFLSYIRHADAVITNSFHGTVFSVLFQKKFWSVRINTTSSRAENLLNKMELTDRFVEAGQELDTETDIDFTRPFALLQKEREESLAYLRSLCLEKE